MDEGILDETKSAYPFLGRMQSDLNAALLREGLAIQLPPGAHLVEIDSPCRVFPLIASGVIRIGKMGERGRELVLYRVHPGEYCVLSLCGLLTRGVYPAYAVAEGAVRGIALPSRIFERMFVEVPEFRTSVFENLWGRLGALIDLVGEFAFLRLDQRVAALLLRLSHDGSRSEIAVTHQDLANQIGSSREIVSRALEMFAAQGTLSLRRGRVILERPDDLRRRILVNT